MSVVTLLWRVSHVRGLSSTCPIGGLCFVGHDLCFCGRTSGDTDFGRTSADLLRPGLEGPSRPMPPPGISRCARAVAGDYMYMRHGTWGWAFRRRSCQGSLMILDGLTRGSGRGCLGCTARVLFGNPTGCHFERSVRSWTRAEPCRRIPDKKNFARCASVHLRALRRHRHSRCTWGTSRFFDVLGSLGVVPVGRC